jgi:hypothetical protein
VVRVSVRRDPSGTYFPGIWLVNGPATPAPGATYCGANNYRAGLMAGSYLGRWAKRHWAGDVEEVLLIELQQAGSLPKAYALGRVDH